jgi:hypothetical protein
LKCGKEEEVAETEETEERSTPNFDVENFPLTSFADGSHPKGQSLHSRGEHRDYRLPLPSGFNDFPVFPGFLQFLHFLISPFSHYIIFSFSPFFPYIRLVIQATVVVYYSQNTWKTRT